MCSVAIPVRSVFNDENKYFSQVFVQEYLYKYQSKKKEKNNVFSV